MGMSALSILCCALLCACAARAQSQACLCNFPGQSVAWGLWGACIPNTATGNVCDNAKQYRQCFLGLHPVSCFQSQPCTHEPSCTAAWTTWSPVGPCSTQCGTGLQLTARNCYRKGSNPPFRLNSCAGSAGAFVQHRNVSCSNNIGCRAATMPTRQRTTPPLITTTPPPSTATSTQRQTTASPTTSGGAGGPVRSTTASPSPATSSQASFSSTSTGLPGSTVALSAALDYRLLAAILGSVLILCITIVVIAVVVTRRRKRNNKSSTAGRRLPTSADRMYYRESGEYQEAGPPLPDRPAGMGSKELVDNSLYETIDPKKMDNHVEEEFDSGYQAASDLPLNGNGYLQPFNSGPPVIPETVYLSLERNGGSRV